MDVLFFAKLREEVGLSECTVNLADLNLPLECSISQLIDGFCSHDQLVVFNGANMACLKELTGENLLASIDHVLVDDFNLPIVMNESEVAFFPPVTGG